LKHQSSSRKWRPEVAFAKNCAMHIQASQLCVLVYE
jgi:hypothetical protein